MTDDTTPPDRNAADWNNLTTLQIKPRLTEEQRRFEPGWGFGSVAAIATLAAAVASARWVAPLGNEALVRELAQPLGIWILAYLIGWLTWRVTSRSATPGRVAFCLVAVALAAGQASLAWKRAEEHRLRSDFFEAVARSVAAYNDYAERPVASPDKIPAAVEATLRDLDALRARADFRATSLGRDADAVRALAATRFSRDMAMTVEASQAGSVMTGGIEAILDPENLPRVRARIKGIEPALQAYATQYRGWPAEVEAGLAAASVPQERRAEYARWLGVTAADSGPALTESMAAMSDFVAKADDFFAYLDANRKSWVIQGGQLVFKDSGAMMQSNAKAEAMRGSMIALQHALGRMESARRRELSQPPR